MVIVIEIRNRKLPGDHWQKWGTAGTEQEATHFTKALRAALGDRYEVRRRQAETVGRAVLDTHGGAQ